MGIILYGAVRLESGLKKYRELSIATQISNIPTEDASWFSRQSGVEFSKQRNSIFNRFSKGDGGDFALFSKYVKTKLRHGLDRLFVNQFYAQKRSARATIPHLVFSPFLPADRV